MAKAIFNSQQDCIKAVREGKAGQEALMRFIRDEERAGRIDELAGTVNACMSEYIAAQVMGETFNTVEANRISDFYELMLRTSTTLRKREEKTQEETAHRLEPLGLAWEVKTKWPTPKQRPRLLSDEMYKILVRLSQRGITEQVNEYQFLWTAKEGATLYGYFAKEVSRVLGIFKPHFTEWVDWDGFSEIFVNGEDMKKTAKETLSHIPEEEKKKPKELQIRGMADNGTERINGVLNDFRPR